MERKQLSKTKKEVIKIYKNSKMVFTEKEFETMELTDFGLGDFYNIGLSLVIYVNTKRVCAKEMALLPNQICPQHKHPPIGNSLGKEETFRCRWGEVYLYISGPETKNIKAKIPKRYKDRFTVFHEIILKPGEQYTLETNTWHWFQGGEQGAVLSEFSTYSYDEGDIFYDKKIKRIAVDN
ncbi:MAG: D-lyxose/D-mannose family sugar isomerase [Actinobacteria bacterium]|jgi:D-lyxose ketol-isomerase|nr:MAG: D-lyxose/D-mannose family sugar isomerase [Actinomycetota bacterium]